MFKIRVYQGAKERTILAAKGTNLLNLLLQNHLFIESPCGGMGICKKCTIKIIKDRSKKDAYYESACGITVDDDMTIEIPETKERHAQIMTSGQLDIMLSPSIHKKVIELKAPDIQDQISDVERIETAMGMVGSMPNDIMSCVSKILRDNDFKIAVVTYEDEILSIEPCSMQDNLYGIAIDIGTTTIVGYLMDLCTGEQLDVYSSLNPQSMYGADVITRIGYTLESSEGLSHMTDLIRDEINNMIHYFCQKHGFAPQNIYEIDVVGNTVMLHIFVGLPVENIALSPFIPVICRKVELVAKDVDIDICRNGKIVILPMVSGYVGADTVAAILACGMHKSEKVELLIDIGTNGEIALGNKDNIVVCSTAAGPAFEGARIECGIGGIQGAVNRVFIDEDVEYSTIGGLPAQGICGSGIVDVIAQMLKVGLLESSGRILSPEEVDRQFPTSIGDKIILKDGQPALILETDKGDHSQDLYISQKDIREVQLAKGAIAAGIEILMKEMNISYDDVSRVYLAGGFGNYIDHGHAVEIGLIPEDFRNKIEPIGNGAGIGAKMALLSKDAKAETNNIKEKMQYIELSAREDFQTLFIDFLVF